MMETHQITDTATFDSGRVERTPEGYLRIPAIVARTGVQTYRMLNGRPDSRGEPVGVLRHPDDVFDQQSLASWGGKPVTVRHPSEAVTANNIRVHGVGLSALDVEGIRPRDDLQTGRIGYVRTLLQVTDAAGTSAVADGAREISCGYGCQFVPEVGVWGGVPYQYRQRNIRGNHFALLPPGEPGRAGPEVRLQGLDSVSLDIIDGASVPLYRQEAPIMAEQNPERVALTRDSETIELTPGALGIVRRWLEVSDSRISDLEAQLSARGAELATVTATRDAQAAELAQLKAQPVKDAAAEAQAVKDAAEKMAREIASRVALLRRAEELTRGTDVKLTADMAPADIRLAVLKSRNPQFEVPVTDSADPALYRETYLHVAFDALAGSAATLDRVDNSNGQPPVAPVVDAAEAARVQALRELDARTRDQALNSASA